MRMTERGMRKQMVEEPIIIKAKRLRKNMTKQERHLWYDFLRNRPEKWYKQKVIGNYIVDFCCDSFRIIIELDGSQHYEEKSIEYDNKRSKYLEHMGYKVIRFTNTDVDNRFNSLCETIVGVIKEKREFIAKA